MCPVRSVTYVSGRYTLARRKIGKPAYFFRLAVKLVMIVIGWLTSCDTRSIRIRLPSGETL